VAGSLRLGSLRRPICVRFSLLLMTVSLAAVMSASRLLARTVYPRLSLILCDFGWRHAVGHTAPNHAAWLMAGRCLIPAARKDIAERVAVAVFGDYTLCGVRFPELLSAGSQGCVCALHAAHSWKTITGLHPTFYYSAHRTSHSKAIASWFDNAKRHGAIV